MTRDIKKPSRAAMREVLGYIAMIVGDLASRSDPDFEGMASHDAEMSVTPSRRVALYALATELTERSWKLARMEKASRRRVRVSAPRKVGSDD
jgi:hypothetical protein